MAKVILSGTNLTEHFTFADYGKKQTGTIPIDAAAEIAQKNVDWYKQWEYGEKLSIGDRRWSLVNKEVLNG